MTFIRMQEYSECSSNKIRNRYFTLEQYMDWYANKYGDFDYLSTVLGMNMNYRVIEGFTRDFDKKLRKRESWALDRIKEFNLDVYCVISTCGKEHLDHEIRHAFYENDSKYRRKVNGVINQFKLSKIKAWLKEMGYNHKTWNDEINAYLVTGLSGLYLNREAHKARRLLKDIDKKYVKPKLEDYPYIK